MRIPLLLLLLAGAAAADTSPRTSPPIRVEQLGGSWTAGRNATEDGLAVRHFTNTVLNREEVWHQADDQEWFLKVRKGVFVLGVRRPDNNWQTDPSVLLVRHRGKWIRTARSKR